MNSNRIATPYYSYSHRSPLPRNHGPPRSRLLYRVGLHLPSHRSDADSCGVSVDGASVSAAHGRVSRAAAAPPKLPISRGARKWNRSRHHVRRIAAGVCAAKFEDLAEDALLGSRRLSGFHARAGIDGMDSDTHYPCESRRDVGPPE